MSKTPIVRFAPSPTGQMHIGNVRAALFNYLFARKHDGQFWVRIEDTDQQRNISDGAAYIQKDLSWLGLTSYEGPVYQSSNQQEYLFSLAKLIDDHKVYKCFCTPERLDEVRKRQIAAKQPPRYDGTCRTLDPKESSMHHAEGTPFIWRLKRNQDAVYTISTMERGTVTFDMKHYADFPLTRSDESFTFIFANFVDDMLMKVTHVIRGEDHLSNTGMQAALYDAFGIDQPMFIHLPLLCDRNNKKLSKRDFGFSLEDIREAGISAPALCQYLLSIGGKTIEGSFASVNELGDAVGVDGRFTSGTIKYDLEALRAVNKRYLGSLTTEQIKEQLDEFLDDQTAVLYTALDNEQVANLLSLVATDASTLFEYADLIKQILVRPDVNRKDAIENLKGDEQLLDRILEKAADCFDHEPASEALKQLKTWAKEEGVGMRPVLTTLRYSLTGSFMGFENGLLVTLFSVDEFHSRFAILANS